MYFAETEIKLRANHTGPHRLLCLNSQILFICTHWSEPYSSSPELVSLKLRVSIRSKQISQCHGGGTPFFTSAEGSTKWPWSCSGFLPGKWQFFPWVSVCLVIRKYLRCRWSWWTAVSQRSVGFCPPFMRRQWRQSLIAFPRLPRLFLTVMVIKLFLYVAVCVQRVNSFEKEFLPEVL